MVMQSIASLSAAASVATNSRISDVGRDARPQDGSASTGKEYAPGALIANPKISIDPDLGMVVVSFLDEQGKVARQAPSVRELEAYKKASQAEHNAALDASRRGVKHHDVNHAALAKSPGRGFDSTPIAPQKIQDGESVAGQAASSTTDHNDGLGDHVGFAPSTAELPVTELPAVDSYVSASRQAGAGGGSSSLSRSRPAIQAPPAPSNLELMA